MIVVVSRYDDNYGIMELWNPPAIQFSPEIHHLLGKGMFLVGIRCVPPPLLMTSNVHLTPFWHISELQYSNKELLAG